MTDIKPVVDAGPAPAVPGSTERRILDAARERLGEAGFAAFSTRAVSDRAGVPLSQIHYHFGSKHRLLLRVLSEENETLVARQRQMFEGRGSFAEKWDRACDYLETDMGSGYVRRLHELLGQSYTDPEIAAAMRSMIGGWQWAIADLVCRSLQPGTLARVGLTPQAFAALAAAAFLGAETQILIGLSENEAPNRQGLRQVGRWIALLEARQASDEAARAGTGRRARASTSTRGPARR